MSGEPIVIKLVTPIRVMGELANELTFRKPSAGDLRVMDQHNGEIGKTIALISHLANVPVSEVDKMDLIDFKKCADVISGFTGGGPVIGGIA